MIEIAKWFEREFTMKPPAGTFPLIVERLRGTPTRIEEKLHTIPAELLTKRIGNAWSIQENIGHLLDLEPLWSGRLDDLLSGKKELRPADLTNRATHEADHNSKSIESLASAFRTTRLALVKRLDELEEAQVVLTATHPRLGTPMRTIDLCHFVAEHDDHHLARTTELFSRLKAVTP